MLGHNLLSSAAAEITQHHAEIDLLMSAAESRAKAIGEVLVSIQPVLKEANISLTEFCKELPFGKTAAYEYISLAKGKKTWEELHQRKNPPSKDSATAENFSELAKQFDVSEQLIERWEQRREGLEPSDDELSDDELERLRWIEAVGIMQGIEIDKGHQYLSHVLNKPEALHYDSYNLGYVCLLAVSIFEHMREQRVSKGDIKSVREIVQKQKVISKALHMSLDEALLLCQLVLNQEANLEGLKATGHSSHHPFHSAYHEFFDGSRSAEDWCCEAMYEEAIQYLEEILGDSQAAKELRELKNERPSFWVLSTKAAQVLKGRITQPYPS
jgi:DNA-binding transcriptional MerR regulator